MRIKLILYLITMSLVCFVNAQPKHIVDTSASCKFTLEAPFKIDVSANGRERQFPFVYKFGANIFISYSEHRDAVMASPLDAMIISRDNGKTWTEKITHEDFYITSMFKKGNVLYAIVYFTYPVSPVKESMIYWTSEDQGKTWTKHRGLVNTMKGKKFKTEGIRKIWGSMLFHRGMQVMKDGSVQGVMYGYFEGQDKYSVVWVRSDDTCATWNIVSVIASGLPGEKFRDAEGFCEPSFAKTKDGSVLCVMRVGSYQPLFQSRSYDGGTTWSKPVPLPGLSASKTASVDPQLLLTSQGHLVLTYGRPSIKMALSRDGCGYKWDCVQKTYENETTGYSGIVETGPGKLLLVADQGRTGAKEMAIWGRFINLPETFSEN